MNSNESVQWGIIRKNLFLKTSTQEMLLRGGGVVSLTAEGQMQDD